VAHCVGVVQVGSCNLWPNRVLKTQNVMEWRSFFNTSQANNVTKGAYMTTHKADLGDHDGRKMNKNYTLPFGPCPPLFPRPAVAPIGPARRHPLPSLAR
jgi:hypothetical protein